MVQKHKKFLGKLEEGTICSYGISISLFSDTQTKVVPVILLSFFAPT